MTSGRRAAAQELGALGPRPDVPGPRPGSSPGAVVPPRPGLLRDAAAGSRELARGAPAGVARRAGGAPGPLRRSGSALAPLPRRAVPGAGVRPALPPRPEAALGRRRRAARGALAGPARAARAELVAAAAPAA